MPIFLATLSLRATSHDYAPLWEALGRARARCLMDATWLVDVSQDAMTVTNALLSHCVPGDKLFVLEFVAGAAWTGTALDPDTKAWLAQRMSVAKPKIGKRTGRTGRNRACRQADRERVIGHLRAWLGSGLEPAEWRAMTEVWRLISMLQIAAVCSWLILTVSSLVPGTLPLSSRASSTLGHAALYFTAGAVTRAALPDVQSRWQIAAFLVAAAVFEVCQIWIPGRSAGVNDWVASSLGACLGVVVVRTVLHHDLVGWL